MQALFNKSKLLNTIDYLVCNNKKSIFNTAN